MIFSAESLQELVILKLQIQSVTGKKSGYSNIIYEQG